MQVAWMTPFYPWDGDPISGSFHRTQARSLVGLGVGIRVVAPRPWAPFPVTRVSATWKGYAALPRAGHDGAIDVRRPPYLAVPGEPAWARPSAAIARAAREHVGADPRPALIHGHFVVPTGMAARRVARTLDLPYLLTVHGYDATSWPAAHANGLGEYRATLRDAATVITVSRSLAGRIGELAGIQAVTLPLGVDHAALRGAALPRSEARERLGLPQDRPIVLFAARAVEHKGIRELVEAVLGLGRPYLAVIIGNGPLAGHRAEEGRRDDMLRYHGPQDRAGVVSHMCAADMLVLPSYQEGLPTVLVEAGSLGLPVIATAVDGTPELLGEDRGILIPPRDPAAIATAIRSVADDPEAAAGRAGRLRAHVETDFDSARNAATLLAIYERVAAGERVP